MAYKTAPSTVMSNGSLREKMPGVTAWIDSLRDAFGKEMVDQVIRTGLGDGTFWAVEKGLVVGHPPAAVLDKHFAALNSPIPISRYVFVRTVLGQA